ncbi:EXS family-domain-containing protein [Boletus reticuloceps]|uniref:EXS family-domain-containing protein n=1 Tax=Boletus reticuloceps TaxID=495285 RepID=A0A8I2YWP8_9AGAM|nr:EXS family-domain-containing protein [Boletus reticuloceps]
MYVEDPVPLAAIFPLPFRALFLVALGVLGWATNLHGLQLLGIDGPGLLELQASSIQLPLRSPSSGGHPSARSFYMPLYRIFVGYTSWCFVAWFLFRAVTQSDATLADVFRYVPAVCVLGVVTALVCPYDILHKRERDWFFSTAARCLFPASDRPVYFSDVVFADVLTSFAKVLGDMWLSLCMLLPGGSLLQPPSQDGWYQWILPSLMSLPYLIRLRQCLIEYNSPTNSSRRPLFNAIKYASSFPVIFLSAAQRIVISDLVQTHGDSVTQQGWHGEHPLFRLWLISCIINSLYSFWWDLTNDWGLCLLTRSSTNSREDQTLSLLDATRRRGASYPYGLRSVLLYPLSAYPMVIFLNFILRMTWSIKLSSHLYSQSHGSVLIFWLEIAEVLRRWVWVFLRIEWETVRRGKDKAGPAENGIPSDDIELFDAHNKGEALIHGHSHAIVR